MASKASIKHAATLPVREGEEPWTAEEVAEVRTELVDEIERMNRALAAAQAELQDLIKEGSDGAGRDSADISSSHSERDQEMTLAANAREMLEQAELALRLFDEGNYGLCEVCEEPIGKARLSAFPRATMCVRCKQRAERR